MSDFSPASIEEFLPLPAGTLQYPYEYSAARGAIVLRVSGTSVVVGLAPGAAEPLVESLRRHHRGMTVEFRTIDRVELVAYLGDRPREGGAAPRGAEPGRDGHLIDRLADDAPIVNLVNSIIIDAIRGRASDIHIETTRDAVRVRHRIDGALSTTRLLERSAMPAVSSRLKVMANLNIMERRIPQDGRMSVAIEGESVDLRVSVVPVAGGESIVLRLFNRSSRPLALDELGFSDGDLEGLRRMARHPHGLVLVTGPTGSGKTTTLNALIREIYHEGLKVVTIEDPVEYLIDGVNQIQTNEAIKLTFESLLRRVLRQDPDVVMIGEIRDAATAELAVRAAMTGHLVLSTLHANGGLSAVPRLKNMGIEPYLIASTLRGVASQRLVRRLCPRCARRRAATPGEAAFLRGTGRSAGEVFGPVGCDACGGSGYRGRVVVAESFLPDPGFEEIVLSGGRVAELRAYLAAAGRATMLDDGLGKIERGVTTVAEIEREVAL